MRKKKGNRSVNIRVPENNGRSGFLKICPQVITTYIMFMEHSQGKLSCTNFTV
jgi:hypothetical protein